MKLNKDVLKLLYELKQRHPHTYTHSVNVASYALLLGKRLGLDKEELEKLEIVGMLHDIGKLKIPDEIIHKPGKFTDEEYEIMKKHPTYSVELLKEYGFDDEELLKIIQDHHERIDGKGYPQRLSGDDIPFLAKIISIADSYDAMTSNRCYREKKDINYVRNQFLEGAGSQFDVRLSMLLLSFLDEDYVKRTLENKRENAKIDIKEEFGDIEL